MKTQVVKLIAALIVTSIFSSTLYAKGYSEVMKENIDKMYKAQSALELTNISLTFYRVSEKEKEWLPLYYATYSLVRIAFFIKDGDEIDNHLDIAQEYMDKLLKDNPEESEIHVLQALLYSMRITSPARGMKYSGLSNKALDKAEQLCNDNPRVYYCRGNNLYHTPSFFGGGKDKAKPLFEKAAQLYVKDTAKSDFWPLWGKENNTQMIAKCTE